MRLACQFAYICARRSVVEYRHDLISSADFLYKKLKILPFMVTNVGKDGTFRRIVVFRLWIHSGLRKL